MTEAETLSGVSSFVHGELGYSLPPSWLGELRGGVRYASGQGPNLAPFPALAGPAVGTVFAEQARDLVAGELAMDGFGGIEIAPSLARSSVDQCLPGAA